jgi:multiple sugar transport system substrate-binding protein
MIAARAAPAVVQTEVIRGLFGTDSPLDEEMLRAEGEAFEELTGVRFEFQTEGANLFDRVATLVAGQSDEFDIYHSHYAQIGRYLGGFYPLNEYAERDGVEADQFIGGSFDALTVDEQLLAIPMRVDVRGFYYRTDIFEEAGIAAPPATRDELVEIALATNNPPGIYGYATVGRGDPALREFSDLLWENGGDFLENGLEPSRPIFNEDPGVEALQWWYDLIHTHEITFPGTPGYEWRDLVGLYASGQAVMSKQWNPGPFEDPAQSVIVDLFGIAPIPAGPVSGRTTAVCHARAINAYSNNKEAAWEFIRFESGDENWLARAELLGEKPSRLSALEEVAASATGVRKDNLDAALAKLGSGEGYTWPLFTEFNQIQPVIWGQIEAALTGQKTPKEALDEAAAEATRILEEANLL